MPILKEEQMLLVVDEFLDFINEEEIEFEALQTSLLRNYIEKIERKNKYL